MGLSLPFFMRQNLRIVWQNYFVWGVSPVSSYQTLTTFKQSDFIVKKPGTGRSPREIICQQ